MTTTLENIIPKKYKDIQVSDTITDSQIVLALSNATTIESFFEQIISISDSNESAFFDEESFDEPETLSIFDLLRGFDEASGIYATILPFTTPEDANTEFTSTGVLYNPDFVYDFNKIPNEPDSQLNQFIRSQGFLLSDFKTPSMINSHSFLQQMYDEIENNSLSDSSVLAIVGILPIQYAIMLLEQNVIINQSTAGIYDPVQGSGSLFNIEITTPITISKQNSLMSFDELDDEHNKFGYSPLSIFGDIDAEINVVDDVAQPRIRGIQLTLDI